MKKRFILLFGLLGIVTIGATSTAINVLANGESSSINIFDDSSFKESYDYKSYFTLPNADSVFFKVGSKLCKATHAELVFPNGNAVIPGKYELSLAGNYKVRYFDNDSNIYEKSFVVNKNVYDADKGVTASYGDNPLDAGKKSLNIKLVSGASFRFNKIVDLNSFPNGDVNVCRYYPEFKKTGSESPAASFVTIKIVDAYDVSKYVEFYSWASSSSSVPYYVGAGASFQNLTGLEYNSTRADKINCVYDGVSYNCHNVGRYQSVEAYGVWTDFYANDSYKDGTSNRPGIRNTAGIGYTWNLYNQIIKISSSGKLITDLDAPEVYDTNVLDYKSFFTTGEVYAQVEAFVFNSSSVDVHFEEILGLSGSELENELVYDQKAPEIECDFIDEDNASLIICKGEKFNIPTDIVARDFNYYGDLKTDVYYNYGRPDAVSIYSSDHFIPQYLGSYTLVYTATDGFGNVSKKEILLNSVSKNVFTYEEQKLNELVGADVNNIPCLDVVGLNGEVTQKCFAIDPKGNRTELKLNKDGESFELIPLYIGQYKISYELSDRFYSNLFEYNVNSVDKQKVYFENKPILNPAYIKSASYSLEEFTGVVATTSGPKEVSTVPYISFDDGVFTKINNINEFKITGSNNLKLKFETESVSYETDEISIVDLNFDKRMSEKQYTKYFIGDYQESSLAENSLKYKFNDGGSAKLINPVSMTDFVTWIDIDNENADNFELKITDLVNEENYILIEFIKFTDSFYNIRFTQSQDGVVNTKSFSQTFLKSDFTFKFTRTANTLMFDGKANIGTFDLMSTSVLGIYSIKTNGKTTFDIRKVNNQSFASSGMSESAPVGHYVEKKTGVMTENEEYFVSKVIFTSVFSPILRQTQKVTVKNVNGEIASDINGVKLENVDANKDYLVKLEGIGRYEVRYSASYTYSTRRTCETAVNDETYHMINITDTIAPEVSFSSLEDLYINVGDRIKIRSLTYSDNFTSADKLKVFIMVFDDKNLLIESGYNIEECSFFRKGTFKVTAFVYDEAGNLGVSSYNVIVR